MLWTCNMMVKSVTHGSEIQRVIEGIE